MWTQMARWISTFVIELICIAALALLAGVQVAHWGGAGHETLAASIAGAVAGGVLGNFVDRLLHRSASGAGVILSTAWGTVTLPANHDLARAIREATILATEALAHEHLCMIKLLRPEADRSSFNYVEQAEGFERAVRMWGRNERRRLVRRPLEACSLPSVAIVAAHLRAFVHPMGAADLAALGRDQQALGRAVAAELGLPLDPGFEAALNGDPNHGYDFTLGQATAGYFMERAKTDAAVYRALSLELQIDHGSVLVCSS